jgi:hypothetical protein
MAKRTGVAEISRPSSPLWHFDESEWKYLVHLNVTARPDPSLDALSQLISGSPFQSGHQVICALSNAFRLKLHTSVIIVARRPRWTLCCSALDRFSTTSCAWSICALLKQVAHTGVQMNFVGSSSCAIGKANSFAPKSVPENNANGTIGRPRAQSGGESAAVVVRFLHPDRTAS